MDKASYKRALHHGEAYTAWCQSNALNKFPVTSITIGSYIVKYVDDNNGSAKSIDNVTASLKTYCAIQGQPWLNEIETKLFAKIYKQLLYEDIQPIKRKSPLTRDILISILNTADTDLLADGASLQLLTLLFLGHDTLMRAAELLNLRVRDIQWFHQYEQVVIQTERSKTHQAGPAEQINLYDYDGISSYKLLANHLTSTTLYLYPQAYVFPRITKAGADRALEPLVPSHRKWLAQNIKDLVAAVGLDPNQFSGHSLRAGGATDLFKSGVLYETIKKAGRWKSDEALIYIRDELEIARQCAKAFGKQSKRLGAGWGA